VFITDPHGVFELVLFLLIYEAVKGPSNTPNVRAPGGGQNGNCLGICYVSCTCEDDVWQVKVHITVPHVSEAPFSVGSVWISQPGLGIDRRGGSIISVIIYVSWFLLDWVVEFFLSFFMLHILTSFNSSFLPYIQ
jgi:hypothetical protein